MIIWLPQAKLEYRSWNIIKLLLPFRALKSLHVNLAILIDFSTVLIGHVEVAFHCEHQYKAPLMVQKLLKIRSQLLQLVQKIKCILR